MNFMNRRIYNILNLMRNKNSLNYVNRFAKIDDYNLIIPNLYLGNINAAHNINFLIEKNIGAIVNCTEKESFHEYFENKPQFRLTVNDSKEKENIEKFRYQILDAINFIYEQIKDGKPVFVHCYWGLMRSATVVACYLIKVFNISYKDAIHIIREQRPYSLLSIYNFNEILEYIENLYYKKNIEY